MELYVGVVTHNCLKYTQQTISTFRSVHPHNWVIVDNGSYDGTLQFLEEFEKQPNRLVIRNRGNLGVAKGWNQIIDVCMHDMEFKYVWLINNDLVLNEKSLDPLLDFVKAHPEYLLASGCNTRDFKVEEGKVTENVCDFSAFLLTRACIDKVGLFDENFQLAYFEDNDYHERVKRAGVKSCMLWFAPYYHIGSRTINEGDVRVDIAFQRNRDYFKRKWGFLP